MKSSRFSQTLAAVLLLLGLIAGAFPADAQLPPPSQGQVFMYHEELAEPGKLAEYEQTTKEMVAAATEHHMTALPFNWTVLQMDNLSYGFLVPIQDFADIGKVPQGFAALAGKMGAEKFESLMRRASVTMRSYNDFLIQERPDLSYKPAKPRLTPEEMTAFRIDTYYVRPGNEAGVEKIAHEWAQAMTRIGFGDGFTVYQGLSGNDLPVVAVVIPGKSAADIAGRSDALDKALGAAGQDLRMRTMALMRRFESHYGVLRPDLSCQACQGATAQAATAR
jgi:hypothetical protein